MKKFSFLIFTIFLHVIPAQLQSCGQVQYSAGIIINGNETQRGEFPFLVSLFMFKRGNLFFFCGANLITTKHALTAGHCIHEKRMTKRLQPEDITVKLGKYNIKKDYEIGEVTKKVSEIILHEDWNPYTTRYDADIAIVVFDSEVHLSQFINTVCLPTSGNLIKGEVVGYGVSERTDFSDTESTPRKAAIKTPPTNEYCFLHNPLLASFSSNRTFCAGGENSGPCEGDSGGGFYVQRGSVWYLQGITSASIVDSETRCDVKKFALYTNVASYVTWINEKISTAPQISLKTIQPSPNPSYQPTNSVTQCCLINLINSIFNVKCCVKIPAEKLSLSEQCCKNYPGNFELVQQCFQNIPGNSDSSDVNCQAVPRMIPYFDFNSRFHQIGFNPVQTSESFQSGQPQFNNHNHIG